MNPVLPSLLSFRLRSTCPDWWRRYLVWRRAHPITWGQVGWYFGGTWALVAAAYLDAPLPAAAPHDLLYLAPLGIATWRLGRQAAWLLVLNASTIRLIAMGERVGHLSDAAVSVSLAAAVLEFGLCTYGLLLLRDALAREQRRAGEDVLTALLNRRAFTDVLSRALSGERRWRRRTPGNGALAYVDLDGFKAVNDTQGHEEGDAVLQVAAEVLRGAVRAGDVVARIGGDEFAVWLPGATEADARTVAERALDVLRTRAAERGWKVGASIGVAVFAERPESATAALTAADALMYRVKHSGKGRVHVALVPVG